MYVYYETHKFGSAFYTHRITVFENANGRLCEKVQAKYGRKAVTWNLKRGRIYVRETIRISRLHRSKTRNTRSRQFGSGTLRRRTITGYPSLPKSTVKWETQDSNDIISWMKMWHEELRHDQQEFLKLYMQEFGCTRNEAKARTFGMRYGNPSSLHDFSKGIRGNTARMFILDDLNALERRVSGIFGSKEI